ncbi:hypothetical protein [Thetidibacter halocola]|nr:hypothetical protein [Thetidibacter halocola]
MTAAVVDEGAYPGQLNGVSIRNENAAVTNHGTILGLVNLGKGNDSFTNPGPDGQGVFGVGSGTILSDGFAIASLDARNVIL